MSASSKPPRRTGPRPPTTEQVAQALLDAEVFGDQYAARKSRVHPNTVKAWRRAWGDAKPVIAAMNKLRKPLSEKWIDEARAARRVAISRCVELIHTAKNLTSVTNAARRLNEIVMAHEIIHEDPGTAADTLDDQPHDTDQREASGASQGTGGEPGDEGPGDLGGGES